MLEVNDELMTPGCPQCAVKHLSAALYYQAQHFAEAAPRPPNREFWPGTEVCETLLARAYINLGEVLIGYKSHLWFAVGMLQASEEEGMRGGEPFGTCRAKVAREARLLLTEDPRRVREAMDVIANGVRLDIRAFESAHYAEALRELPGRFEWIYCKGYAEMIEWVRKEYFVEEGQPAAPQKEGAEEGGETEMATKKAVAKAPAKKADAKAVQAACKGGKCKGKKCK